MDLMWSLNGEPLDAHQARDLLDREALAEIGQHFALARREPLMVERRAAPHRHRPAALEAGAQRYRVGGHDTAAAAARAGAEVGQQSSRDRRREGRLPTHDFLQFLDENLEAIFLQQIAVGAALQRGKEMIVVRIERRDDLRCRVLAQLGEQFHAVAVGQLEVDEDQLERVGGDGGVAQRADLAACRFQVPGFGDR